MAGARRAKVELTADPSKLGRGLGVASAKLATFGKDAQKKMWPATPPGRALGWLEKARDRGVRGLGRGAAGIGRGVARSFDPLGLGFDLLGNGVDEVMNFERAIARMAIAQGKSNDQMEEYRAEINALSSSTGIARNELLAGAATYQALTGDTKGSAAAMQTFARVSKATGATMDEVAATGASLIQNLKVEPGQLEEVFSIINSQGKAGAVELRDLAALLPSISAKFQQFKGGAGVAGVTEMGAALQIVRRNFGSAAEAATGMEALMGELVKKNKKLGKAKIKVFAKGGGLREFSAIIKDIADSELLQKDGKLEEIFGSKEALDALRALTGNYGEFQRQIKDTDTKSIGRDFDQYMTSPAGKMEQSWNRIKLAIAEIFTPARIKAFADGFDKAVTSIEYIVSAIEWIQDQFSSGTGGEVFSGDVQAAWAKEAGLSSAEVLDKRNYPGQAEGYHGGKDQIYALGSMMIDAAALMLQAGKDRQKGAAQGDALSARLEKALRERGATVVELKLDGATAAKAIANGSHNKTRPGG